MKRSDTRLPKKKQICGALQVVITLALCLTGAFAQMRAQTVTGGATPVIDNERVRVHDVTLTPGTAGAMEHHENDFVTVFLVGGKIRTTGATGRSSVMLRHAGDAVFGRRGTEEKEEVVSGSPARLIVVELKDFQVPPLANKSGYPPAFPRPGAKKVLDNDRVRVWNYAWVKGAPTRMHYHDTDVLVVYREDGSVKSTTLDGQSVVNDYTFGTIRFNKRDRIHSEELVKGSESAIMVELK